MFSIQMLLMIGQYGRAIFGNNYGTVRQRLSLSVKISGVTIELHDGPKATGL